MTHHQEQIMTITVWDKGEQFCGQCRATKQAFDKAGVSYQTRDVTAPENADQLQAFKDAGHQQSPIVETPTDTWSGFRPDRVKAAAAMTVATQHQQVAANTAAPGLH